MTRDFPYSLLPPSVRQTQDKARVLSALGLECRHRLTFLVKYQTMDMAGLTSIAIPQPSCIYILPIFTHKRQIQLPCAVALHQGHTSICIPISPFSLPDGDGWTVSACDCIDGERARMHLCLNRIPIHIRARLRQQSRAENTGQPPVFSIEACIFSPKRKDRATGDSSRRLAPRLPKSPVPFLTARAVTGRQRDRFLCACRDPPLGNYSSHSHELKNLFFELNLSSWFVLRGCPRHRVLLQLTT